MKLHRFERTQILRRPLEEVFDFFTDPQSLRRLTPPSFHFEFLGKPPGRMKAGTVLDYRVRVYGVSVKWRARIEVFEPPGRFVDSQVTGPYSHWRHIHLFEPAAQGGTTMRDRVDFALPLGPLGEFAYLLFVRRTLSQIFDYRARRLSDLL
jgi:ligand-binding SRPBCC domain-containing protein